MLQWLLYSLGAAIPAAAIGGYYEDGIIVSVFKGKNSLKPRINPKDNGRVYLAFIFFALSQSCYVTYINNGIEEVLFGFITSLIFLGPLAYGLGYLIRKNNLPK